MVPKQRHTKSRRNRRRAHHALRAIRLIKCSYCAHVILPHHVCPFCGYYKGRQIIDVMAKLSKREKKTREKEQKENAKMGQKQQLRPEKNAPLSMEQLSRK